MKKITLMILAAAVAAASCQKETGIGANGGQFGRMTINAVSESLVLTTEASATYKYDILWDEANKIMVKNQDGSDTFTLQEGAGTTKGKFTQDHNNVYFAGEVEAFYPASVVSGEDLVWPATQQNDPVPPLYTKTTVSGNSKDFIFSSLGAILQIALSTLDGNRKLTNIELCDSAKPLSGKFTVNDSVAVITDEGDGNGSITLSLDNAELSHTASDFNIAVPAGKYDDLTLVFYTDDGCAAVMNSITMPEIQRNTVARISLCIDKFVKIPDKISLDKTSLNISYGCYYVLTPTVSPEDASLVWSSSDSSVASVDQYGKVTAKAAGKAVITATTMVGGVKASCNVTVTSNQKPEGALPALFRVSPQRQVYFSKGNLKCYDYGDYQFENAQYDYQESWDDMSVGHFYWLSDSYGAMLEEYDSEYLENEFFTNDAYAIDEPSFSFHVAGQTGVFRNMSSGEWSFLLGDNEFRKGLYAIGVTVVGKTNCLIIYPDGYTGEIVNNGDTTTYSTKEGWGTAEEAGVVCLPAAGQRQGSTISESGQTGRYWSGRRSPSTMVGNHLAFDGSTCFFSGRYIFFGHAVRLVANY